jgi:hypothetical protein
MVYRFGGSKPIPAYNYNFGDLGLLRGGTAPAPPEINRGIASKRATNSSHKVMVNAMNYAAVKGMTKVTL